MPRCDAPLNAGVRYCFAFARMALRVATSSAGGAFGRRDGPGCALSRPSDPSQSAPSPGWRARCAAKCLAALYRRAEPRDHRNRARRRNGRRSAPGARNIPGGSNPAAGRRAVRHAAAPRATPRPWPSMRFQPHAQVRPRLPQSTSVTANGFVRPPTNGNGNELSLMKMKPRPSPRPNNIGSDSFKPAGGEQSARGHRLAMLADEGLEMRHFNARHCSCPRQRPGRVRASRA